MNAQIQYDSRDPLTSAPTLRPVAPIHSLPPGDECYFTAPVRFGRRRADQCGHLELTSGWLKFSGTTYVTVAWTEVESARPVDHEMIVALTGSRRVFRFACAAPEEAARGAVIASYLAAHAAV